MCGYHLLEYMDDCDYFNEVIGTRDFYGMGRSYTVTFCPICEHQRYMVAVMYHNFQCEICESIVCKFIDNDIDRSAFKYSKKPVLPENFWENTKKANMKKIDYSTLFKRSGGKFDDPRFASSYPKKNVEYPKPSKASMEAVYREFFGKYFTPGFEQYYVERTEEMSSTLLSGNPDSITWYVNGKRILSLDDLKEFFSG